MHRNAQKRQGAPKWPGWRWLAECLGGCVRTTQKVAQKLPSPSPFLLRPFERMHRRQRQPARSSLLHGRRSRLVLPCRVGSRAVPLATIDRAVKGWPRQVVPSGLPPLAVSSASPCWREDRGLSKRLKLVANLSPGATRSATEPNGQRDQGRRVKYQERGGGPDHRPAAARQQPGDAGAVAARLAKQHGKMEAAIGVLLCPRGGAAHEAAHQQPQ
jgi:hypothetical protein